MESWKAKSSVVTRNFDAVQVFDTLVAIERWSYEPQRCEVR